MRELLQKPLDSTFRFLHLLKPKRCRLNAPVRWQMLRTKVPKMSSNYRWSQNVLLISLWEENRWQLLSNSRGMWISTWQPKQARCFPRKMAWTSYQTLESMRHWKSEDRSRLNRVKYVSWSKQTHKHEWNSENTPPAAHYILNLLRAIVFRVSKHFRYRNTIHIVREKVQNWTRIRWGSS